jgi:hypothetical protein
VVPQARAGCGLRVHFASASLQDHQCLATTPQVASSAANRTAMNIRYGRTAIASECRSSLEWTRRTSCTPRPRLRRLRRRLQRSPPTKVTMTSAASTAKTPPAMAPLGVPPGDPSDSACWYSCRARRAARLRAPSGGQPPASDRYSLLPVRRRCQCCGPHFKYGPTRQTAGQPAAHVVDVLERAGL